MALFYIHLLILRSGRNPTSFPTQTWPNLNVSYGPHASTAECMERTRRNPMCCKYRRPAGSVRICPASSLCSALQRTTASKQWIDSYLFLPTEITDINQIHGSDASTAQRMRKARRISRSCKHCGPAGPIELCYAFSFYPVLQSATASTQWSHFYFPRPTNVVEHKCKKKGHICKQPNARKLFAKI